MSFRQSAKVAARALLGRRPLTREYRRRVPVYHVPPGHSLISHQDFKKGLAVFGLVVFVTEVTYSYLEAPSRALIKELAAEHAKDGKNVSN